MKRFLSIIIIALMMASTTVPQQGTPGPRPDTRDPEGQIVALAGSFRKDPKLFDSQDDGYRLASLAKRAGQLGRALQWFHHEADRNSDLADMAVAHASLIARATGNGLLERIYLGELGRIGSRDLNAVHRLAENGLQRGDPATTVRLLTSGERRRDDPAGTGGRDRDLNLAKAYVSLGRSDEARPLLSGLITGDPRPQMPDDRSLEAVRVLDKLDEGLSPLPVEDHRRRGQIYLHYRDIDAALRHFESMANIGDAYAPEAFLNIGRAYVQASDHGEAVKWYERLLERYPDSAEAKDALLRLAGAYSRVGKVKEALARYQSFIDKYPTDEMVDRAYLNQVDVHRDQADITAALTWCDRTASTFAGKPPAAVAMFSKARMHLTRDQWRDSLAILDRLASTPDLGGMSIPGGTNSQEVAFLRGLAFEKLGRFSEAIGAYLSIPDGRNAYYGWKATERLRAMAESESSASAVSDKAAELTAGLQAKDAEVRRLSAQQLLRLRTVGERLDRAMAVLRAGSKNKETRMPRSVEASRGSRVGLLLRLEAFDDAATLTDPTATEATRAELLIKGDRADRALRSLEPLFDELPLDTPLEIIPRERLTLLYPVVFRDSLLASARRDRVDPRLMLAIMRQESRFDPEARSGAGARGLMQFVSTTATQVAREVDVPGFEQDDLYDPELAIRFGSRHLADLFKIFPKQTEAVVAAYNSGEDNMTRWLARSRSDEPARYVPEIMFTQTKDYVYRVMANLRVYQMLYDEELRPIGPMAQPKT